ncbi:MAG: Acetyl xylan esterase [Chthoniobacteraceae bacterium]|nr:Acetyl xylan esterase [Chthoniobacteraceae bacterium]
MISPVLARSAFALVTLFLCSAGAQAPRVLPAGELPKDLRLEPLKDLDGYFPFSPPASREAWEKRAERVRRQILVAEGLWPLPTKTPLKAVIHGKIDRGEYTVEKVYFESAPGFFVTGNLYRPKTITGKVPGVLSPHGHWPAGRFLDTGIEGVKRDIADGAERFEEGGRSSLQARCVMLARLGCVVFHWDMLGNADSIQIPAEIIHKFAKQRPEMNTAENWGLYSPQAEAHLQSVMGLQTWNAIRALDFLLSLPEIDPERIAVTGESGGGTQTMLLSAIDPRIRLSFPAVMVSTSMQGGCTCENASLLRIGTGNVEFAALFAPKPQGMNSADDWTKELSTKGFPELKALYTLLGAPDEVMLNRGENFKHNFNYVTRAAMLSWVNSHFKLGHAEPIEEPDFQRLTEAEMSVWDDLHPKPAVADPEFERSLLHWFWTDAAKQLAPEQATLERFKKAVAPAVGVVLGRNLEEAGEVEWKLSEKVDKGAWLQMSGLVSNKTHGEQLPVLWIYPKKWTGKVVLWLSEQGKAGLFNEQGEPTPEIAGIVAAGSAVVGVDLLYQGEFLTDAKFEATPTVRNPRESAAYTFGYNPAVFAHRVHDILTMIQLIRSEPGKVKQLDAVALDRTGPILAAARSQSGDAIRRAAIGTGGFRFASVLDLRSPDFLPGGAKYGDLPGLLALSAPRATWLAGESKASVQLASSIYQKTGASSKLTFDGKKGSSKDAVKWLLAR